MWILLLVDRQKMFAHTECYGPYADEEQAKVAAFRFLGPNWIVTVHEVKTPEAP